MDALEKKRLSTKLRSLCEEKYPDEFSVYFRKPQADFRDWLNSKTNLNVCHISNFKNAAESWITALED